MTIFSLRDKQKSEEDFHDRWAEDILIDDLLVEESFDAVTAVENRAALEEVGNLRGKKVLDLGCGAGESSVYFALQGADVFAVDISSRMLEKANELAAKYCITLKTYKMVAEELTFESDYFDFIFGNGVLHHCNVELAVKEVSRVLKKDCLAIFIEPLAYNPVIKLYRKIAKEVRTDTETPFNLNQIACMKPYFSSLRLKFFWLSSQLIFIYMYLIERVSPLKERYWKRVIKESKRYTKAFKFFNWIDGAIVNNIPFLGRFCWNALIILKK